NRDDRLAGRVGGIGQAYVACSADIELAVGPGAAVEHKPIKVGVGDVAGELAQLRAARPGVLADFGALELPGGVLGQRDPKADLVGAGGDVADVAVVGIGGPEGRS